MPGRQLVRVWCIVEALLVLCNIFIELGDQPELIEDFNPADIDTDRAHEFEQHFQLHSEHFAMQGGLGDQISNNVVDYGIGDSSPRKVLQTLPVKD